jgi:hypothetical protein
MLLEGLAAPPGTKRLPANSSTGIGASRESRVARPEMYSSKNTSPTTTTRLLANLGSDFNSLSV